MVSNLDFTPDKSDLCSEPHRRAASASTFLEEVDALSITRFCETLPRSNASVVRSREAPRSISFQSVPNVTKPRFHDSTISGSAPKVLQRSSNGKHRAAIHEVFDVPEASTPVQQSSSRTAVSAVHVNETPPLILPDPSTDTTIDWPKTTAVPPRKRRRSSQQQVLPVEKTNGANYESRGPSASSQTPAVEGLLAAPPAPCPDRRAAANGDEIPDNTTYLASETEQYEAGNSSATEETSLEFPTKLIWPQRRRSSTRALPVFHPLHSEQESIPDTTHAMFSLMQQPLSDRKDLDEGHIYTLRVQERPGYIKIGRTKDTIRKRQNQINRCIGGTLQPINDDDRCKVPNHSKVETLIHRELHNHRHYFQCFCRKKPKQKQHDCDGFDGSTKHGEWFKIDETKAIEIVDRWRSWMSSTPYCDGVLRPNEKVRIDYYAKKPARMNGMIAANGKHWHWNKFMRISRPWLWYLRLQTWLHEERHRGRSVQYSSSRWDSLWRNWQANLSFYIMFFVFSFMISVVSSLLPSTLGFVPVFPLINSLTLGSWAIMYAA